MRYITIIDQIKRRRQELGWSQEQVARRLHVPRTWIGKVERRERRLDLVEAWEICRAYRLDIHAVIRELEGD